MSGININFPAAFEQEVVYKECRRNHAASLGRVSHDGCREFLQSGEDAAAKEAMLCVACGCHRSFHRKETVYNPITQMHNDNILTATPLVPQGAPSPRVQVMNGILSAGTRAEAEMVSKRKKRTMFTQDQRNQMKRFAESLGWRPQKTDREAMQRFCMGMGISRRMFLVWLSNNRRRVVQ